MIILDYKWKWGSNSVVSKWMFHWEWQQRHQNWFPPPKSCSAAIFPKAIPGSRDMVSPSNYVPVQDAIDWAKPRLRPEVSRSRLQAQHALGQELQHEAWAHGLAGLGPCPVQGVGTRDHTIGPRLKAQRARGSCIVQVVQKYFQKIQILNIQPKKKKSHE